jgi:elongation factor G
MAFKTAAIQCLKKGILEAKPVLFEPVSQLKVVIPDDKTGDVMGDLNKRHGKVIGMNPVEGKKTEIVAEIPDAELFGYGTALRSLTAGEGVFSYEFLNYQQAPSDIQEKEIEHRKSKLEEEE